MERFYRGMPILIQRNDYGLGLFNGDTGILWPDDQGRLQAWFAEENGEVRPVSLARLPSWQVSYAITVHKAQGSEYPAVVIPVLTQHYVMLQRNLLYTAITRGKKLVIVVGSKKALAIAIRNDKTLKRYTLLKERLSGAMGPV